MDKQITQIFINRNKKKDQKKLNYIFEGEGIVEIGKERETVKKDQLIFSPAKVVHTLLNESETSFKFLVIKTPTPTTETKVL